MTLRRLAPALLLVVALVVAGWWWWQERAGAERETARRDELASPVPAPELVGRGAEVPATTPPLAAPTPTAAGTWRLEGRVTGSLAGGVAGARVDATIHRGTLETLVGSATTDREGRYAIDLAAVRALGAFALPGVALYVAASGDGYGPAVSEDSNPFPPDPTADYLRTVDLELAAGDVLRGRVVRQDGTPVGAADVAVCDGRNRISWTSALPDGRFVLPRPAVPEAWVVAHHVDVGAGRVRLASVQDRVVPDVVLETTPSVEGSITFLDGSPVAGIGVTGEVQGAPDPCIGSTWGHVSTISRADGTFRVLLPFAGECSLYSEDADEPVRCRAGDRGVRIVVRTHRLRVRVVDAEGRGLPGLVLKAMQWMPEAVEGFDALVAGRIGPDEARRDADFVSVEQIADPGGAASFFGAPGSAWVFLVDAPGSVPAEATVKVPAEGNETEVRIVLRSQVGGGGLRVRVLAPDGQPVPHARVTVATALGSHLFRGPIAGDGRIGPFPEGTVRLTARAVSGPDDMGWIQALDMWLLDASGVVAVRAGADAEIVLRPQWGGRVRVTLRSPGGAGSTDSYSVRATEAGSGSMEWLMGQVPDKPDTFSSEFAADTPTLVGDLLVPGTYKLEVSKPGPHWITRAQDQVTVRAREVADVTLYLTAR